MPTNLLADDQEPLEGFPQLERQIHTDRVRRADRAGRGGCSGRFWALYFLQQVSKVDALTSAYIVGAALLIATPSLIFFGWLSDRIGRKPVILGGTCCSPRSRTIRCICGLERSLSLATSTIRSRSSSFATSGWCMGRSLRAPSGGPGIKGTRSS